MLSTGPESGAVGVPLTATLVITFSKQLLAGSEGTTSFTLFRADDQKQEPLAGQLALDGSRLRFFPAQPLDPATVYQVRMVGATSFLGDRQLDPYHWTFETLDPEPPPVTRTEPEKDETEVPRDAAVTVYFQRAIRVGGQECKFTLTGPDGEVDGYLEWVPGDTYPAGYGMGEVGEAEPGWNTEGRYQGHWVCGSGH